MKEESQHVNSQTRLHTSSSHHLHSWPWFHTMRIMISKARVLKETPPTLSSWREEFCFCSILILLTDRENHIQWLSDEKKTRLHQKSFSKKIQKKWSAWLCNLIPMEIQDKKVFIGLEDYVMYQHLLQGSEEDPYFLKKERRRHQECSAWLSRLSSYTTVTFSRSWTFRCLWFHSTHQSWCWLPAEVQSFCRGQERWWDYEVAKILWRKWRSGREEK